MAVDDAYVFPGFLTSVLTQLFFPKLPTTFLTCFCRSERRNYARKKSGLKRRLNSQPPGHEFDTLTTEPPGQGNLLMFFQELQPHSRSNWIFLGKEEIWSIFTDQQFSRTFIVFFSKRFCKYECNTTSDWLNCKNALANQKLDVLHSIAAKYRKIWRTRLRRF